MQSTFLVLLLMTYYHIRYTHVVESMEIAYNLPSWFDYNQFKLFFGKRYSKPEEDEVHKRIYLRTALEVFERRSLYRTNRTDVLPSINELSDMVSSLILILKLFSFFKKLTGVEPLRQLLN